MSEIQSLDVRIPAEIIHNWGWFLAFGIGLALLGILAIVRAVAATVVSMLFFGWLLVIAAGIEIVQAIMVGKWAGLFQHWLGAVLFGVIGILILWRPLVTAEILTLLMGAFFLVAGLFQLITPFVISLPDWGWHTLNGLIILPPSRTFSFSFIAGCRKFRKSAAASYSARNTSHCAAVVNRPYPTTFRTCVQFFCSTQALSFF
jgi:uncharacterized membrane protein HdeD (DUF308 family)